MTDTVVTVMVVDDDASLRRLVSMLLDRDPRIEVVGEAHDGRSALDRIPALDPDVLVLDLAMPGMNGFELLKELADTDRPVVAVLTGFADPNLRDEVLAAGAADFLSKGDGFASLADRVVELGSSVRD
jgi:two-component system chemotaxis response regulator CheB